MKILKIKKRWLLLVGLPLILFSLFGLFLLFDRLFPLPIKSLKPTQTILAEDGSPLWRFADQNGIWRYPLTLDEVPDYYIEALITYEDKMFYKHWGIDPTAIARASWQNLTNKRIISGGSTLSMQVARLIEPHDRTIFGKLNQVFRTLQLEWHYSKDEILTFYINRAPYGGTIEGIGAASWSYFRKPAKELTPSEAALMVVLPQSPSRLRPDRYPERAQSARDKVLDRLAKFNTWTDEMRNEARKETVWLPPRKAPHLAPLLARRLIQQYPQQNIIATTINESLQYTLEDVALNWKNRLPPKTSLAILVVDHTNMEVKSYVGSVDFNDGSRFGQVDMITALRSPGSTLKPFLYGFAFDENMIHSESLLQDVPRITTDYRPSNFDTGFNGPVGAAESLLRSLNLPAVQLLEVYGPKQFAAKLYSVDLKLQAAGSEPNLSYILGGASLKMEDLVSAYSAFARHGNAAKLRYVPNDPLREKPLLSEGSAWIVRRILSGDGRPPLNQEISEVVPLGWKTGTSYGYRDAWAVGINARYLIGIWIGRPDGTPVAGQYGTATAVPLLEQVNTILINRERNLQQPLPTDPKPDSVSIATICWPTGQPLNENDENCHRVRRGWVLNNVIPPTLDSYDVLQNNAFRPGWIKVWVNKQGFRVRSDCPDAKEKNIALWPIALEKWVRPNERRSALIPPDDKDCPVLGESNFSQLIITGITNKQLLKPLPGKQTLVASLNSQGGYGQRWWFLDGNLMATLPEGRRFELSINGKGTHNLLLMDESGQIDQLSFTAE